MSTGAFIVSGLSQDQINSKPELNYIQKLNNELPDAGTSTTRVRVGGTTVTGAETVSLSRNTVSTGANCVILGNVGDHGAFTNIIQLGSSAPDASASHQMTMNLNATLAAAGAYSGLKIPIQLYDNAGDPTGVLYLHLFN